jgi:hypothetical protein
MRSRNECNCKIYLRFSLKGVLLITLVTYSPSVKKSVEALACTIPFKLRLKISAFTFQNANIQLRFKQKNKLNNIMNVHLMK